ADSPHAGRRWCNKRRRRWSVRRGVLDSLLVPSSVGLRPRTPWLVAGTLGNFLDLVQVVGNPHARYGQAGGVGEFPQLVGLGAYEFPRIGNQKPHPMLGSQHLLATLSYLVKERVEL